MTVRTEIQKRFADSDVLGHVNNVNLQHYFDVGKSDFFKQIAGIGLVWKRYGLITASTTTNYLAQTRYEENVAVETALEKIGNKSFTLFQRIVSLDNDQIKAESHTVLVAFDFECQTSIEIPKDWREAFVQALSSAQE